MHSGTLVVTPRLEMSLPFADPVDEPPPGCADADGPFVRACTGGLKVRVLGGAAAAAAAVGGGWGMHCHSIIIIIIISSSSSGSSSSSKTAAKQHSKRTAAQAAAAIAEAAAGAHRSPPAGSVEKLEAAAFCAGPNQVTAT
eukprot:366037-Chlamydomonas_euryale.AAC.5